MRLNGRKVGFAIGKYIRELGKPWENKQKAYQKSILEKQNKLDDTLWQKCKDGIKGFSDEQFEDLADYINKEVCTGDRKYSDARHEVYSKLKNDMISYQYKQVLKKIK